ncbi:MAG: cob(I)yrinic acid a,c-diamide adenosyltransferase [Candidatus Bathyarchaeia archaeon]
MTRLDKGLVQVYTGDGKGKTSAAFGLALRAAGRGLRVYIIQFIKGGFDYGELYVVERVPNVVLKAFGRGKFVLAKPPEAEDVRLAEEALSLAREVVLGGEFDVVVLDEVNVAADLGLVEVEDVLGLVRKKPKHVELVLTGRNAPAAFVEVADLVTEMREVKHPFRKGVAARKGIEF